MNPVKVTAIVLNYNGVGLIEECLSSLLKQTYRDIEILVVDNHSEDGSVDLVRRDYPQVKMIENEKNLGFAKAINIGVKAANGQYIFILNNDTRLRPTCIEQLANIMTSTEEQKGKLAAGLAPKMLFDRFNRIFIDSVGNSILQNGTAYNNGIGQIDLGQFDFQTRVFGLCFGAAFIRKDVFNEVGFLDESFFAYYEDVDWCYRANLLGYQFYTAPAAMVYHKHSASWRKLQPVTKYFLIHRNFLRTVLKNYYRGNLIWFGKRTLQHVMEILIGVRVHSWRRVTVNLKILLDTLLRLPVLLYRNLRLNRRRRIADWEIWRLAEPRIMQISSGTFDPPSYSPVMTLDIFEEIYGYLAVLRRDERLLDDYVNIHILNYYLKNMGDYRAMRLSDISLRSRGKPFAYRLENVLIFQESGRHFARTEDGTIIVDSFILETLLNAHNHSFEEVVELITSKLGSPLTVLSEAITRTLEIVLKTLVQIGLLKQSCDLATKVSLE